MKGKIIFYRVEMTQEGCWLVSWDGIKGVLNVNTKFPLLLLTLCEVFMLEEVKETKIEFPLSFLIKLV